jgi:hypothetical protein
VVLSRRGVSTAVDAVLALVLVSAAVLAVTGATPPASPTDRADETVETLSATTATVEYSLAPGLPDGVAPDRDGADLGRRTNGSLTGLLAAAAVANASVAARQVTHAGDGFERAVENATREALTRSVGLGADVRVRARWRPYRGARLRGLLSVGDAPPPGVDVHAATTTVPTDAGLTTGGAVAVARVHGFAGLATALANATARVLFPRGDLAAALRDRSPVDALARHRYRRGAALLGTSVDLPDPPSRSAVARADRRLRSALARRFGRRLRERYRSPVRAARDVRVAGVVVTVERWSG